MEIWAYVYSRGERIGGIYNDFNNGYPAKSHFICQVKLGAFYDYRIYIEKGMYVFVVTDNKGFQRSKTVAVEKHTIMVGYQLGTYFGGNVTAPHDMNIIIKNI